MDYVLVHGTAQSPEGWQRLADSLARRGHRVRTVDLAIDRPGLRGRDYARAVAEQVADFASEPVLVAHSGSGAALPAVAREVHASHLVWLAAFVPDPAGGRSLADEITATSEEMFNAEWRSFVAQPTDDPVTTAYFLFHDCNLADLRWALSTTRFVRLEAVYAEVASAVEQIAPSTYVLPRDDRTLRPEWMRAVARERLGVEPIEIEGGHCPHVSRPDLVADILEGSHA